MWKFIALIVFCSIASQAIAHEDTPLTVSNDGTIRGLPPELGPAVLELRYAKPGTVSSVRLATRRFKVRLNPCLLSRLTGISEVAAYGSWYHDLKRIPPYISLKFFSTPPSQLNYFGEGYSVTLSLVDGHIIGGQRTWDPWWGRPRGLIVNRASQCGGWAKLP